MAVGCWAGSGLMCACWIIFPGIWLAMRLPDFLPRNLAGSRIALPAAVAFGLACGGDGQGR